MDNSYEEQAPTVVPIGSRTCPWAPKRSNNKTVVEKGEMIPVRLEFPLENTFTSESTETSKA